VCSSDLGLRQAHFVAKRAQMRRREVVVAILDQMQKLDQEIGASGPGRQQLSYLPPRLDIELAPLRKGPRAFPRAHIAGRPIGTAAICDLLRHCSYFSRLDLWKRARNRLVRRFF